MSEEWYHEERRPEHYPSPTVKPYCRVIPAASADGWKDYLRGRGLSWTLAQLNGWYGTDMDGVERVVIPATASDRDNCYWQARDITGRATRRYESPHGVSRGDAVVIVWPNIGPSGVVVVEGPMCALAAAMEGFQGIALLGLTPPDPVISFVAALVGPRRPLFVADSTHPAGMAEVVSRIGKGGRLVDPYPHKDLADAPRPARQRLLGVGRD